MACIKLEEYQTAKAALGIGASLAPGDSRFTNLIKECDMRIAEEANELPKQTFEKAPTNITTQDPPSLDKTAASEDQATSLPSTKPKYRHEFYQKPEEVVVTVFAKGILAKSVAVDFGEQILSVTIDVPGEDLYTLQPRLFGKIIPAKCKYEVLSTKIEIRLAKAEAINWTSLEFSKDNEKEEKLDGDAALNKFFRDIYQDADEDTRKAMRKSFTESNGTVLSTNWKEVGEKKVEGSPPDGMEMKKWEY
ncbi:hypothetical protein RJ639_014951 [Escallonia herrerae]|uniref:Protein SGT1 homolog n=1 Tax=Escallonia herrerae TaxID=1293975 RepID=A0AA89AMP2_9ASTE|nr:hypothetical protein RJ639_014951 [Escallonia herrerae]